MKHAGRWLVMALVAGIILRLIGFSSVPVSPYWDEMAIWNDALSIRETGLDMHSRSWLQPIFISYGDFKLPVYIWLTALVSTLTSDILVGVRATSLLAGISSIPAIYLLSRYLPVKAGSARLAVVSSMLVATLPWSLHFSRVGFEAHLGMAFVLWAIVASFWAIRQQSSRLVWLGFVVSAVLGGLAVYSYFSTRFVFPVVFLLPLLLWWRTQRQHWLKYLTALFLWGLLLIPMYRADFYSESNRFRLSTENVLNQPDRVNQINLWRLYSGNTFVSRLIFNQATFVAKDLSSQYAEFVKPDFLFFTGDENLRHGIGVVGLFWVASSPFLLIGIAVLARHNWRLLLLLFIWWLVAVLPAAVPYEVPHALRSLNALPIFVLLMAVGVDFLWSAKFKFKLPLLAMLGLLAVFEITRFYHFNLVVYPELSANHWQDGYLQASQLIEKIRDDYDYIYVDGTDRFFLYYLPYSGLSYRQIQQLPTDGFARHEFDKVKIGSVASWDQLPSGSLVITKPDRISADTVVKFSISGAAGREQFVAVESDR